MKRLTVMLGVLVAVLAHDAVSQARRFEIRYAFVAYGTKRNATLENTVGRGSGMMTGGEISVRMRLAGLTARLIGGSFAADSGFEAAGGLAIADARLSLGPRVFAATFDYTVRALSGNYGTRRWRFYRAGIRSVIPFGASGFSASGMASVYLNVRGSGAPGSGSGKEAETRLTYVVPGTPFWLMIGYRLEGFTVNAARNARPEELSGLLVGGGVRLAR